MVACEAEHLNMWWFWGGLLDPLAIWVLRYVNTAGDHQSLGELAAGRATTNARVAELADAPS